LAFSIAVDQVCRWAIKHFSCLLGNAVFSGPTWITQSLQQRFVVSGVVVCQLVCKLAVNIILVNHCPYADLLTNLSLKCAN